jgi:hypothetical protein
MAINVFQIQVAYRALFLSIAHRTQCLDHKKERQIKGLEKGFIANEGMQHSLHKGTHK